jgi:Zn-dependent metalloprotease
MHGPKGPEAGPQNKKPARMTLKDGYLRSLGAPARHYFPVTKSVPNNASVTAKNFIAEHRTAFGINSRRIDFSHKKSSNNSGRSYERFQQTYSGIPVFGAEVLVQLTATGGIEFVLSDIMRNTRSLDSEKVSTAPTISAVDAEFSRVLSAMLDQRVWFGRLR